MDVSIDAKETMQVDDSEQDTDDVDMEDAPEVPVEEFRAFLSGLNNHYWNGGEKPDQDTLELETQRLKEKYAYMYEPLQHNPETCASLFPSSVFTKKKKLRQQLVAKLLAYFEPETAPSQPPERTMVNIVYQIQETSLSHNFDLQAFSTQIEDVFAAFFTDSRGARGKEHEYIAPYFVFVQSSGMGKTKILYEYKKINMHQPSEAEHGTKHAKLVLCRERKDSDDGIKEERVFDDFLSFQFYRTEDKTFGEIVEEIFGILDRLLESVKENQVVLMFDEAHYLTRPMHYKSSEQGEGAKQMEALLFRIVRLWLCQRRQCQVVGVFAGTTIKLTNFMIDDDVHSELLTDTRSRRFKLDFYSRGTQTFEPFFTTTTIGCLRKHGSSGNGMSEYEQAIPYGRPLFAVMTQDECSRALSVVASRMLQDTTKWTYMKEAWLSVLGTRVQMGQTSFEIASTLVGRAYANLVGVVGTSAHICFMPDPVCARLAMCLMDENWSMKLPGGKTLKGQSRDWWVGQMKSIYCKQLCKPEKGDLGEVMVALYFLFCADVIRGMHNSDYNTFSVPLDEWIKVLVSGGEPKSEETQSSTERSNKRAKGLQSGLSFGAIQVCRNYVRAYDNSWDSLRDENFLEQMYKSGVGFYVFAGCSTIELVFALRLTQVDGKTRYLPMFVSVKCHVYFGPAAAQTECDKMKEKAKDDNSPCGALCILVVFGSETKSNDGTYRLSESCVSELEEGKVVSMVLRVPVEDKFGLTKGYLDLTTFESEFSEVLASHSFLGAHVGTERDKEFSNTVLRLNHKKRNNGRKNITTLTRELFHELRHVGKKR